MDPGVEEPCALFISFAFALILYFSLVFSDFYDFIDFGGARPDCGGTPIDDCGGTPIDDCGETPISNCGGTPVDDCGGIACGRSDDCLDVIMGRSCTFGITGVSPLTLVLTE